MFKSFPIRTVLLTILACMLFLEVKETVSGEREVFVTRWLYSDIKNKDQIEVATFIMTDQEVAYLFAHPNELAEQSTCNKLNSKNVNAVLRFRNLKGGIAGGTVEWGIKDQATQRQHVNRIPTQYDSQKYGTVVISLGNAIHSRKQELPDPIIVEWKELYICR